MSVYVVSVVELNGDVQYSADLLLDLGDSTDSAASQIGKSTRLNSSHHA